MKNLRELIVKGQSYTKVNDFTNAIKLMCSNIEVLRLDQPDKIFASYEKAYLRDDGKSTILVEYGDYYNEK